MPQRYVNLYCAVVTCFVSFYNKISLTATATEVKQVKIHDTSEIWLIFMHRSTNHFWLIFPRNWFSAALNVLMMLSFLPAFMVKWLAAMAFSWLSFLSRAYRINNPVQKTSFSSRSTKLKGNPMRDFSRSRSGKKVRNSNVNFIGFTRKVRSSSLKFPILYREFKT